MNDVVKELSKQPIIKINITLDKNDKDSLFLGSILSTQIGNKEAKENIIAFCNRQEIKTQKIKDGIPKMLEAINTYFGDKK